MRVFIISIWLCSLLACTSEDTSIKPDVVDDKDELPIKNKKPFPQNERFSGSIRPTHISQDEMNDDVITFYTKWRSKYLRQSNGVTPGGGYYIYMKGTGGSGREITTSEAHGYGMITFALLAGSDSDAKKYFDGMFNMFDQHRSTANSYLMSWIIDETELRKYDSGSATDGDMDIAYALLLADKQWGSEGDINYLQQAKDMITKGIKASEMSVSSKRSMLGDWDSDMWSTRSSDWMIGHFRAFNKVTGDKFWLDAADTAYQLIETITQNYSATTGLMPDFIEGKDPKPAREYYLDEFKETDEYNWNACRYPWRITSDYLHFNTAEGKAAMARLLDFIVDDTNDNPSEIKAGYYLNGKSMVNYSDGAFTGPLVLAATIDPKYQEFLNQGWNEISAFQGSYFGDSICLLNMLLISGNWWNPAI